MKQENILVIMDPNLKRIVFKLSDIGGSLVKQKPITSIPSVEKYIIFQSIQSLSYSPDTMTLPIITYKSPELIEFTKGYDKHFSYGTDMYCFCLILLWVTSA